MICSHIGLAIYSRISPPPAGDILKCNEALLVPAIAIPCILGGDLVVPDDASSSTAVAPENWLKRTDVCGSGSSWL